MPLDPTIRESLLAAIPEAAERGRKALEDWDTVSDSLCDAHHEPLDERYDARQRQRDAEAWAAFEPFLDHGPELLAHAEEDFRALHQDYANPDFETIGRRRSQLTALHQAIAGGREEHAAWQYADEMIFPDPQGAELRRRMEIRRNADGWHHAIAFADNADVLVEIDQATRARTGAGRGRTAQAEAARARSTNAASPTASPITPGPSTSASSGPERAAHQPR